MSRRRARPPSRAIASAEHRGGERPRDDAEHLGRGERGERAAAREGREQVREAERRHAVGDGPGGVEAVARARGRGGRRSAPG